MVQDPTGILWGDRADGVYGAWGHWWRNLPQAAGGVSHWVNYPDGVRGTLLFPQGYLMSTPVYYLLGPVAAHNLLAALYLLFVAAATGLLAARLARDPRAGMVAALAVVAARPLVAHVGVGNLEGLGVGWAALLVWLGLQWRGQGDDSGAATGNSRLSLLVGLTAGVSVVENPYCLPVTAVIALALAARRLRQPGGVLQVALATASGAAPVLLWMWCMGGVVGGTPLDPREASVVWGAKIMVHEHSTPVQAVQFVWPWPALIVEGITSSVFERGGGLFLGWGALAMALLGATLRRDSRWVLAAAGALAVLALGSTPWGTSGPPGLFWLVDVVLAEVTRPLSQPFRYTAFTAVAVAVGAGLGVAALAHRLRRPWAVFPAACALICAEALLLGGPSLEIPGLSSRGLHCLSQIDGPVHTVTGADSRNEKCDRSSMLLQLIHRQPGTHPGIGGWIRQPREPKLQGALSDLDDAVRQGRPGRQALYVAQAGVRWVVAPATMIGPRAAFICGGWAAAPIQRYIPVGLASRTPTSCPIPGYNAAGREAASSPLAK